MIWFIAIFSTVVILLFFASIVMIKISQRREKDAEYDKKWNRIEQKWDPRYNFFVNVCGWGLAIVVILYFYLP
jgi:hypothetical protein